jgi:hypothetical protein
MPSTILAEDKRQRQKTPSSAWLGPVTKGVRKGLHFGHEIVLLQFSLRLRSSGTAQF